MAKVKRPGILFPAYAGVIPENVRCWMPKPTFPRIRGGDPRSDMAQAATIHFSPHTRG